MCLFWRCHKCCSAGVNKLLILSTDMFNIDCSEGGGIKCLQLSLDIVNSGQYNVPPGWLLFDMRMQVVVDISNMESQ